MDALRQHFLDERCGKGCGHEEEAAASGFVPRESKERVKNCSQIAQSVSQCIVKTITDRLLSTESLILSEATIRGGDPCQSGLDWNVGGEDVI